MPTDSGSFGDWLRRQREMREISLRDIAERTKISLRYLEAMEEDRFDLLPAPIFAKGFLREYARYVGLSPDEVVNHYLSVQQPEELADPKEDTKVRARPKPVDPGPTPVRRNWSWGLLLALAGPDPARRWWPCWPTSPTGGTRSSAPADTSATQAPPMAAPLPRPGRQPARSAPATARAAAERADRGLPRLHRRLLGRGADRRQEPPRRAARPGRVPAARGPEERRPHAGQRRRGGRPGQRLSPRSGQRRRGRSCAICVIDLDTVQALKAKKEAR